MMPGMATSLGFRVPACARYSTCTMTMPPEFLAAEATASPSFMTLSCSKDMFPFSSAVVPRRMATSSGKLL